MSKNRRKMGHQTDCLPGNSHSTDRCQINITDVEKPRKAPEFKPLLFGIERAIFLF